jgi:hypothetical protein
LPGSGVTSKVIFFSTLSHTRNFISLTSPSALSRRYRE